MGRKEKRTRFDAAEMAISVLEQALRERMAGRPLSTEIERLLDDTHEFQAGNRDKKPDEIAPSQEPIPRKDSPGMGSHENDKWTWKNSLVCAALFVVFLLGGGWMFIPCIVPLFLMIMLVQLGISAVNWFKIRNHPEANQCKHGVLRSWWSERIECALCRQEEQRLAAERKARERAEREERRREAARLVRTIGHLQKMDPLEFEDLVCLVYQKLGWEAATTRYTGDDGADILIKQDGQTGIVQCKRLGQGKVGSPAVRDLAGAVALHRANFGVLVTTTDFTASAKDTASKLENIDIVNVEELVQTINEAFVSMDELPERFAREVSDVGKPRKRKGDR